MSYLVARILKSDAQKLVIIGEKVFCTTPTVGRKYYTYTDIAAAHVLPDNYTEVTITDAENNALNIIEEWSGIGPTIRGSKMFPR